MTQLPSIRAITAELEQLIRNRGQMTPTGAYLALAKHFELSPEQQTYMRRGRREPLFHNRVQWAREALAKRGLIDRRTHGIWVLASDI